jgi:hypothetical protein
VTFLGIENTNEFFTQHYLAAILESDLKPVLERWRAAVDVEPETRSPLLPRGDPRAAPGAGRQSPGALPVPRAASNGGRPRASGALALRDAHPSCSQTSATPTSSAIGSPRSPQVRSLSTVKIKKADGSPLLWLLPVLPPHGKENELSSLSCAASEAQVLVARARAVERRGLGRPLLTAATVSAETLIEQAFDLDEPPRFVLLLGLDDITLVERAKWAEQRLLRFDLREILGRRQPTRSTSPRRSSIARASSPPDGIPLLDDLDDHSHKHAFAVSEDLKYALQASIERLGNAAVDYIRDRSRSRRSSARRPRTTPSRQQLSRECLRYMYRLLFLFYIEARPELGYAPMGSMPTASATASNGSASWSSSTSPLTRPATARTSTSRCVCSSR